MTAKTPYLRAIFYWDWEDLVFFENTKFIISNQQRVFTTTYTHSDLHTQAEISELAFLRLVGCAYFKKHINAFPGHTPASLLHQWIDHIRQTIWDRISFENEMIPSVTALQAHWLRSCWVLHLWQQAQSSNMVLATLHGNGWVKDMDGKLDVFWDTEDNMSKVKKRVQLLMRGCGCKSGCRTNRCGCRKSNTACGPGCRCIDCTNSHHGKDVPENYMESTR